MDVMLAMSGEKRETFMHSREFPLPICRAIVFKRLYDLGYSTPRIGKFFGKDHATVLHACNTVCDLMDTDRSFRGYVADIEKQLTSAE